MPELTITLTARQLRTLKAAALAAGYTHGKRGNPELLIYALLTGAATTPDAPYRNVVPVPLAGKPDKSYLTTLDAAAESLGGVRDREAEEKSNEN